MDESGLNVVTSVAELRGLVGEPTPRVAGKVRRSLGESDRAWLARSPFYLLATADADGRCDVSPKGDPPGSVVVLDDTTIALPDRPGNRRVDGYLNLLANPHVGLVFLVPGRGDTLRVNGRAVLVRDPPFADRLVVAGHRPTLVLLVTVEEVFFHCSKAFLRSELWEPGSWEPDAVPSRAEIAHAVERPEDSLEDLTRYYGPSYARHLYG